MKHEEVKSGADYTSPVAACAHRKCDPTTPLSTPGTEAKVNELQVVCVFAGVHEVFKLDVLSWPSHRRDHPLLVSSKQKWSPKPHTRLG